MKTAIINVYVKTRQMLVTPEEAGLWLLKNISNRPISEYNIQYLLDQMRRKKWEISTDAIGFDTEGNLINGQHRLMALIRYNKPLEMLVGWGYKREAFNVIDTGRIRTAGDVLGANGVSNPNAKSAIAKFVMEFRKNHFYDRDSKKKSGISNADVLKFVQENPEIHEIHDITLKHCRKFKPIENRFIAGLYWIFRDIDKPTADNFIELYGSGAGMAVDNPIFVLRSKLISDIQSIKKYPTKDKVAWIILAWNAYRRGRKIKSIRFDASNGDFPKPI